MAKTLYTKTFPGTTEEIGQTVNEALDALNSHAWCDGQHDCFCLRLCLEEALVNAMVHGNSGESTQHVHIEIAEEGDRCRVSIIDQGNGFDPDSLEMPDAEQLGGRGVCLIKHFMEEVQFDKVRNCLEMKFSRGGFQREEQSHAK